jgi:hypothetical protein
MKSETRRLNKLTGAKAEIGYPSGYLFGFIFCL